jgi:uncharacterized membrane protein YkvA (DUF1232 family)
MGPDELREALKLLPDLGHLLQRLAADAAVPQRVRIGLAVLIGYMLLPIDLVPDFIPVLGGRFSQSKHSTRRVR